ncbi:hypothetical protein BW730_12545 [Tessaracoccus aquimaris]|uniref:Lipocalin/cytosolic fatty-acid binding domain-containing protein n=1 Tax=Tessaracoccus aquimaris TaxID=1332264 RepID=A0A1Q2CQ11_9ACTN|nr:lipocalin family protein [Tessaracoccus aquimaris]AQP48208.1 hypothetical protein BW730_12545 [Tessaracoccus aquimaris]
MTTVAPVESLDLERYLGLWYEIGRLPLKWEDPAATCITAEYRLGEDDAVEVDNRCFDEAGEPTQSLGRATVVGPGRLKVTFLPAALRWLPFTQGDYWVLKIAGDYSVSLVGTPDHKNLWLLAREPELDEAVASDYLDEARRQGFSLEAWIAPVQDGRRVTDDLL